MRDVENRTLEAMRAAQKVHDLAFNAVNSALAPETFVPLIERERIAAAVAAAIEPEIRTAAYYAGMNAGIERGRSAGYDAGRHDGRHFAAKAIEDHAEAIGWYEDGGVWAEAIELARGE
jgi:hypothetical protein